MGYAHIVNLYRPEAQTILLFKECYALEKIHGCLESETIIKTKDGDKTIKDICESKYSGKIKSFDLRKNKSVWKKIKAYSIGEETEDWLEICIENNKKIKATVNHMFWLPDLKCWRRADEIKEGDVVEIL